MNKSFTARALVMLAGLLLMVTAVSAQKISSRWEQNIFAPLAIGVDIEQCANGPISAPIHCNVSSGNDGYTRGNLIASKSHYKEGDSVPIRIVATDLVVGTSYTVTIGYDFTKGGKYATDYLTDYDRTESVMNDPCVGVAGCSLGSETTFPIPTDPQVTAGFDGILGTSDDITQIAGSFSCFGCTITGVSGYTLSGSTASDSTKTITLTFTADATNVVIAYGSHISTRGDWGLENSAINISGSPYHNFIADFPGANQGNRDLQLSAEAVIFPASVTIVKLVVNQDMTYSNLFQSFGFTATNFGMSSFMLMDTDPAQFGGGSTTNANITLFGSTNTITVTEDSLSGTNYTLASMSCSVSAGGGATVGTATPGTVASRTVTIVPQEGNMITCTFTNSQLTPTAAPANVSGRVFNSEGLPVRGVSVTLTNITTGEVQTFVTNSFGYYQFLDLPVDDFYRIQVSSKRMRFANDTITFVLQDDLADMNFIGYQ